jgi:DNA repair protein RecN (Recombination protein N)
MLRQLSIRNVVLIESLDVEFAAGFSVLTGETGAGKSILLDALGLVLGERSDQALIRKGAEQASVFAEFDSDNILNGLCAEHFIPIQEILSLKRVLQANGRSKAYINDEPVSVNILKLFGIQLIDIHGQHDRLFDLPSQRILLDQKLETSLKENLKNKFEAMVTAKYNLAQFEQDIAQNLQQHAYLQMQQSDFENLKPKEFEHAELLQRREQIVGFAKIANTISECLNAITYPKDFAEEIAKQQQILVRANSLNLKELEETAQGLDRAYIEVKEVQSALKELLESNQAHANELEIIDQRLSELRTIAKKYGIDPDNLFEVATSLEDKLKGIDDPELRRKELNQAVAKAKSEYIASAKIVHEKRLVLAEQLAKAVHKELPDLFLPNAKFQISLSELSENQWSANGYDQVLFEVCMNPGQEFSPLHKSASGGEMARLMLALKVACMQSNNLTTIIFDEIDQGVSGAVALAIGKRLKVLGNLGQILAITHSAQVASQATSHFVVEKTQNASYTATTVKLLQEIEKLNEVGRMLSGAVVTDAAREAAKTLINGDVI